MHLDHLEKFLMDKIFYTFSQMAYQMPTAYRPAPKIHPLVEVMALIQQKPLLGKDFSIQMI